MATIQVAPLIYNKFKGIRENNGINEGGCLSALKCQNVELFNSEIGNEVGIKSIDGNSLVYSVNTDYNIIGIYKSEQKVTENSNSFKTYFLIYAEHKTEDTSKLYYINANNELTELISFSYKTGQCNGLTMTSTAYDVFIFTNGVDAYSICFATGYPQGQVAPINFTQSGSTKTYKKDYEGHDIKFIAMTTFNGFLVVATKYGVRASHQNNIYTWNETPSSSDLTTCWKIDYSKPVTALYAYTGGLFIFTGDTTDFITGTPNNTANRLLNTAGVGCMTYDSIVKHDTYLFFYDNNQKNIYYIENIDNGQTRPSGPIAKEIQSQFKQVEKLKMYSCIYNTRNEIWCFIKSPLTYRILIYDYFQHEWVERRHQDFTDIELINNVIYGAYDNKVVAENNGTEFTGGYYPSNYESCFINAGDNTNLKKQKTPLLITLNDNYTNDFYVKLIVNGKEKSEKHIKKTSRQAGFYVTAELKEQTSENIPASMKYGSAIYSTNNPYSKQVVEISTPQTWYTLAIKIYTREHGQGFCINSIELKNIKAKLKTKGK